MAYADGNIIIGTSVDVGGISTGLAKIQKMYGKLGKAMSIALGVGVFAKLGKAALDAASDLQEIQNVVDVSFQKTIGTVDQLGDSVEGLGYTIKHTADGTAVYVEDMTWKIEQFATTCIEKFGMSELAAKQTAGSFMAMGKSMGLSMDEASDMAVKLTGLTGDFASFYNITQDYARVALSAVYTGETETLKRYGIVLTEANLQQFALSQGITDNVKKMDARSKAILRYQYIMSATADMEGDFIRTQNSWANSVRVVQERWRQFLIVLGDGLISVLTPLVQKINEMIAVLTVLAKKFWQIMSNIFGFALQSVEEETAQLASSTGDAADAEYDLAKGITAATKAANKALAPFDELNVIRTTKGSSSGDIDSGLGLGDIDLGLSQIEQPTDDDWSNIDNWYDFGKAIGDKIAAGLAAIKWDEVFEKARNFGKHLAEFLNGLISTDTFKMVGRTIANSLNTAIYAALSFGQEFDWTQFGQKLAEGVNEFFTNFDFGSLGTAISVFVHGLLDALSEFIRGVDWGQVLRGIYEFFSGLGPDTLAILVGFHLLKKLLAAGLMRALFSGFVEGLLGEATLTALFKSFGVRIGKAVVEANLGQKIGAALVGAFRSAIGFLSKNIPAMLFKLKNELVGGFSTLFHNLSIGNSLSTSFEYAFGKVAKIFTGIGMIISGAVIAVKNFIDMWKNGWSVLKTIFEAIGIAIAAIGAVILGAPAAIAAVVAGIVFAVSQLAIVIHDNWEAVKEWTSNLISGIVDWFKGLFAKIVEVFVGIVDWFRGLWDSIMEFLTPIATWIYDTLLSPIITFVKGCIDTIVSIIQGVIIIVKAVIFVISEAISAAIEFVKRVISTIVAFITAIVATVVTFIQQRLDAFKAFITPYINGIKMLITGVITAIKVIVITSINRLKALWKTITSTFKKEVVDPIKKFWDGLVTKMVSGANTLVAKIKSVFSTIATHVVSVVKSVFNAFMGLVERAVNGIIDLLNDFLGGFNTIVTFAAKIIGADWDGIKLFPKLELPRLASGAVIPPNKEFMAILGDQKRGTNIETPLSTMVDAFNAALAANGGATSKEELALLRQQVQLLSAILEKDLVMPSDMLFRSVRNSAKNWVKTTNSPAF